MGEPVALQPARPSELFLDAPEDELVRRFQGAVRPYAGRVYALLAFVLALIAASTAVGKWGLWLLFSNARSFHVKDPLFGKDLGFYVFRLPFLTFVIDWLLASLLAILVFVTAFHYLNGGIRAARVTAPGHPRRQGPPLGAARDPRAREGGGLPHRAVAHGDLDDNGIVEGAGYADVHYRLPALMLLFWICVLAAIILVVNIFWQRGWTLPVIAIGLWAFVALLIGVIYPAVLQAIKVTPAQSQLELPYINRNIGRPGPPTSSRPSTSSRSRPRRAFRRSSRPASRRRSGTSASGIPASQIAQATFGQLQAKENYYSVSSIGEDRYVIDGRLTPIIEGVRELDSSGLSNPRGSTCTSTTRTVSAS